MIVIPIIQSVVFLAYMGYITYHYGILPSISDSWYELQGLKKLWFTGFIWTIGVTTFMLYPYGVLYVVSGCLLPLVGVAAAFRDKSNAVDKLHSIGATGSIITILLAHAINHIYYPFIIAAAFSIGADRLKLNNSTTWVEVVCVVVSVMGVFQLLT